MAAITAALIKQVRERHRRRHARRQEGSDRSRRRRRPRQGNHPRQGIAAAGKREGRKAQEAPSPPKVVETANGETGAVELNSETDFVAKTPKFVEFTEEFSATP